MPCPLEDLGGHFFCPLLQEMGEIADANAKFGVEDYTQNLVSATLL